ncbi:uncharacterized protein LOC119295321 [Triticum dicoccoides]|uniref:uncharacterized protein LOC119295321 n=1 Tax=Triticum dicoccoides TaxID=85692 RepID=UPI00188E1B73|nr:uncharacterized protein LOC119295321 [Triticum dicoccoides]
MALKKARKVVASKKPTSAAMGVAETPDPLGRGGAHNLNPPRLPPGVYFSPTREESVALLDRWIAGGGKEVPADARGFVSHADIYGDSPDALRRLHPPGSARAGQHTWWFLCETRFQSPGAAAKRAGRKVDTGGYWQVERSEAEGGAVKSYFGFFLGPSRKEKTPWLTQEFTSATDGGAGKKGVPALYMLYVSPRATDDELRGIYGEDGVTVGPDGNKKPVRAAVPAGCFDAVVALLPLGSVRGLGQERVEVSQAPPPPQPACLLRHDGQQGQNSTGAASSADLLGQYQQRPAAVLGQCQQQPAKTVKG